MWKNVCVCLCVCAYFLSSKMIISRLSKSHNGFIFMPFNNLGTSALKDNEHWDLNFQSHCLDG